MKAVPLVFFLFLFVQSAFSDSKPSLIIPKPDSKYNKTSTSISIRFNEKSASGYLNEKSVSIIGSKSGMHQFTSKISDDGFTVVLYPNNVLSNDETVTVNIRAKKNKSANDINFTFQTEKESLTADALQYFNNESKNNKSSAISFKNTEKVDSYSPLDFPQITILNATAPSQGDIFLSSFPVQPVPISPYLMILNNTGAANYYKQMEIYCMDFKKQPDGNLTYYDGRTGKFYEMNSSYTIIDSFYCGNGYGTDLHEIRFVDNSSHVLLLSYDPQHVNMRHVVTGGDSTAIVVGLIIQELDRNRNVIFQWRSWDYFEIIDAVHEDLTAHQIDYVHGNALELDTDGNLLISSRHQEEITKVSRSTGEIIWRFGGHHNQFAYLNDSIKFSYQHAIRRISNGNITLFDNGCYRDTTSNALLYSRAVEYQLDEVNHTARLVWQYISDTYTYAYAMGYVQRLTNGNTIIGWGTGYPTVTEVTPNRNKVYELALPNGVNSYRAYRDEQHTTSASGSSENGVPSKFSLYQNYPNPFNPSTTIKFDIPVQSAVTLSIYNLLGQKMNEVNYGVKSPGSYEYNWNASNLSSGIYFYELKTNTNIETKQMMLIK